MGFRWFVCRAALRCDVTGDVRNLRDGTVELRARGTRAELDALLNEVRQGPPGARVDGVEELEADQSWAFDRFDVRY